LVDPDRRAWHAAQATSGPDEAIAADLERSADRAQSRGGMAAAAAFMERAAELTLDPARRPQRALAAARADHCAGAPNAALRLLSLAEAGHSDDAGRAHVDLLRAQIAFTMNRGSDAPPMLLKAAKQLESFDVRLARETYLDALLAAMFAGGLAIGGSVREVAEAARAAPDQPADLLLDGLAVRFTDGYAAAVSMLREALTAFRDIDLTPKSLRWFWLAHVTAGNLWDEQTLDNARHLQLARDLGAMATLPLALTVRIGAHVLSGDLGAASSLVDELDAVTDATGIPPTPYGALLLAAWQGHERQAFNVIEKATAQALRRGEGFELIITGMATALACNRLSRYGAALEAASKASKHPPIMGVESWGVLVELVEAAVRVGQRHRALDAYARITETTQATRTDWALGIEARCRALLSQGQAADTAYREAVDRLSRNRIRGELARAHLLTGNGCAAEPPHQSPRTATHQPPDVHHYGYGGLRRPRRWGTARHRRDRPQTHRRHRQPAHRPRIADRATGRRGPVQHRDRRPPVHQPTHRGMAPQQSLRQAADHLPPPTPAALVIATPSNQTTRACQAFPGVAARASTDPMDGVQREDGGVTDPPSPWY
jgi:hypothetical protein